MSSSTSSFAFSHPLRLAVTATLRQISPCRHGRVLRQSRGTTVDNGLRLCVKDDLLQLCAASHTRWQFANSLVLIARLPAPPLVRHQVLQQQASRHLTCTSVQELALLVNFMLHNVAGIRSRCAPSTRDRRPSTVKWYDQKWLKFVACTSQVQDDAEAPRMSECFAWFPTNGRHLFGLPRISHNQRKIASALLEWHKRCSQLFTSHSDYPPPACGHLVKLSRKAFPELQGSFILQPQHVKRTPRCGRADSRVTRQNRDNNLERNVWGS